jgi:hypothetical protein
MSKYNAIKTEYAGEVYDSKKEAGRAQELDFLLKGNVITGWERQPVFECVVNKKKICTYRADFKVTYPKGYFEIEDVKGFKTPVYRLKKKLVEALYGIEIKEI